MKTYQVAYRFPSWFQKETAVIAQSESEAVARAFAMLPNHIKEICINRQWFYRPEGK